MYSLAEQAGNGTYDNSVDRTQLNKEVIKLREEIDRIGQTTNFNGTKLFTANVNGNEMKVEDVDGVHAAFSNADDSILGQSLNINAGFATKDGYDYKSVNIAVPTDKRSTYLVLGKTGLQTLDASNDTITNGSAGASVNVSIPAGTTGGKAAFQVVDATDTTKVLADVEVDLSAFNPVKVDGVLQTGTLTFADPNPPTDVTAQGKTPTGVTLTGSGVDLWVGDFPDSNNKINVQLKEISSDILVIDDAHVNLSSQQNALNSLSYIKDAIDYVSDLRGTLGAAQNRLEHTINNLSVMQENIQDAESTIRDTDVAEEMMKYTKNSILVQSAQAMLAQANQQPQSVLQLLQ
jgi:flagellin